MPRATSKQSRYYEQFNATTELPPGHLKYTSTRPSKSTPPPPKTDIPPPRYENTKITTNRPIHRSDLIPTLNYEFTITRERSKPPRPLKPKLEPPTRHESPPPQKDEADHHESKPKPLTKPNIQHSHPSQRPPRPTVTMSPPLFPPNLK